MKAVKVLNDIRDQLTKLDIANEGSAAVAEEEEENENREEGPYPMSTLDDIDTPTMPKAKGKANGAAKAATKGRTHRSVK